MEEVDLLFIEGLVQLLYSPNAVIHFYLRMTDRSLVSRCCNALHQMFGTFEAYFDCSNIPFGTIGRSGHIGIYIY
jgi:hypothetical protein